MLSRWIESWERSIYAEDADERRAGVFGWGLEHLHGFAAHPRPKTEPGDTGPRPPGDDEAAALLAAARSMTRESEALFRPPPMEVTAFDGELLQFRAPLDTGFPEVGQGRARLFESDRADGRAVVVIPQWNADASSHVQACHILQAFGMTALRLTLPYHEVRKPEGMLRADPMVSPVLGRTLQSIRLAVLEVRQLVGWLQERGYDRVGLLGSSLGSCIGFLTIAHDPRLRAAALNHVAAWFADVVWEGLSTRHVRESLDPHVDHQTLRDCWTPISPAPYVQRLAGTGQRLLMVSGRYDPTFLPSHSRPLVEAMREEGVRFRRVVLPCGHYTLGRPPFYLVDALLVATFLRRNL